MFPALVTKPELVLARGQEKVEEEQMVRSEAGSWRRLPQFSTASDQRRRSYHWRKFPILSRRRSDGKPGRYLIVFNYVQGESKKSGISKTMARTPLKSIRKGKS